MLAQASHDGGLATTSNGALSAPGTTPTRQPHQATPPARHLTPDTVLWRLQFSHACEYVVCVGVCDSVEYVL